MVGGKRENWGIDGCLFHEEIATGRSLLQGYTPVKIPSLDLTIADSTLGIWL